MSPVALRVLAIVPLPPELGGAGELLALSAFGSVRLPTGEMMPGESLFAAAARTARQVTGAVVVPSRLVYLHERVGRELLFCVLCSLDLTHPTSQEPSRVGVRFINAGTLPDDFEPAALRDLLREDTSQGFVRPVAHIVLTRTDDDREHVDISW